MDFLCQQNILTYDIKNGWIYEIRALFMRENVMDAVQKSPQPIVPKGQKKSSVKHVIVKLFINLFLYGFHSSR